VKWSGVTTELVLLVLILIGVLLLLFGVQFVSK
jgi:hypothetical protein